jgi:hypothetical protein
MAAFLLLSRKAVALGTGSTKLVLCCRCLPHGCFSTTSSQLVESTTSTVATVAPVGADGSPRYKGASLDKRTGKWKATITVNGKRMHLGSFDDPKVASDAYFAAKAVYASKSRKLRSAPSTASTSATAGEEGQELFREDNEDSTDAAAATVPPGTIRSKYIGVLKEGVETDLWEAVIIVNNKEISGGEYESEEEAAKAYDALARMYLGAGAKTNFPMDSYSAWIPPDEVVTTGQIETKVGVHLTVEEIVKALQQERGIDITTIDLAGKSDLAEQMIFVTGKTVTHMQKMANMLSRSVSTYWRLCVLRQLATESCRACSYASAVFQELILVWKAWTWTTGWLLMLVISLLT